MGGMNIQSIIDQWPDQVVLAADLGVPAPRVRKWRQRGVIPGEYWAALVSAAARRELGVTLADLALASARVA